ARLRHGLRHEPAEERGALRLLAADAIQPGAATGRQESFSARLEGAQHLAQAVRLSGSALHDARAQQSRSCTRIAPDGAGRRRATMARIRKSCRDGRTAAVATDHRTGDCGGQAGKRGQAMIDLTTTYLGLALKNPIVASASPLSDSLDKIRHLEDHGIAAVVLPSLFDEQLTLESETLDADLFRGAESFAESLNYFPDLTTYNLGPEGYLELIRKAKASVAVHVIGSLNGVSAGGWIRYAREMEQAGADAIELNLYSIVTDPELTAGDVERSYTELVREVKQSVGVPVAVKLSPFFSAPANMAKRLDGVGANALVLFNRFYQPDLDLELLEVTPSLTLSRPEELLLRLHWVAILFGRVDADLAITGGVHGAQDVLKGVMAGARVTMMTSALLRKGVEHLDTVLRDLLRWMEEHEYESIRQMCGSMSQRNVPNPA